MSHRRTANRSTAALLVLLVATGCQPATDPVSAPALDSATQSQQIPGADDGLESPESTATDVHDLPTEREQFIREQKLPLDGSMLTAATPEQSDFIDLIVGRMESDGIAWDSELENLYLALAANACESAILSSHEASAFTVEAYALSSPLISAYVEHLPEADRPLSIAAFTRSAVDGMYYLCPEDYPEWDEAFYANYPDFPGEVGAPANDRR